MNRVFFIRHGHVEPDVRLAAADPPLSAIGVCQAEAAAVRLKGLRHPVLFTSPARRARDTAEIVGGRLCVRVNVEPELVEIRGAGEAHGDSRERLSRLWAAGDRTARHSGGESLGEALDRFRHVLRRLETVAGRDLVLVSHGAFIAMGLLHLCDHDLDAGNVSRLMHCATPELQRYSHSASSLGRLRSWNPTPTSSR